MTYATSRLRQVSLAALLISAGVIVGTAVPRARGAEAPGSKPGGARVLPEGRHSPSPAPGPAPVVAADTAAASEAWETGVAFQPEPEGEAPAFGGSYAVLRGARTDASSPVDTSAAPADPDPVPAFPAPPGDVPSDTASSEPEATPRSAPAPFRPSPAQGIPRGVAAEYPLLAIFEGAGRLLFYDLGVRPGVIPSSIEGSWAVLGDCERALQADFSAPTAQPGELRAVGRGAPGEPGSAAVVVARQGCEAASRRFSRANSADAADRDALAGLAPEDFGPSDLAQVARSHGLVLAVYRSSAGSAAVIGHAGAGGVTTLWTGRIQPGDGDLAAIGVFRRGGSANAWLLVRKDSRAAALLAASSPDGRAWSSAGPSPLVHR